MNVSRQYLRVITRDFSESVFKDVERQPYSTYIVIRVGYRSTCSLVTEGAPSIRFLVTPSVGETLPHNHLWYSTEDCL